MSNPYGTYSDDFYVNMNLTTEMDLPSNRETVLHFFELVQRKFPMMKNFYQRERNEYVLEEDKEGGSYRWTTIDAKRVSAGFVNPPNLDEVMSLHETIAELLPYSLSVSPLDCESLNLLFCFDFNYQGNQNQLVAEALGMLPAFEQIHESAGGVPISYEPSIQFALGEDCKTQCRLSLETRTTAFQIRSGDYSEDQLSVYLTVRRFGSLESGESLVEVLRELKDQGENLVDQYVVEHVLKPLQQTIALK